MNKPHTQYVKNNMPSIVFIIMSLLSIMWVAHIGEYGSPVVAIP